MSDYFTIQQKARPFTDWGKVNLISKEGIRTVAFWSRLPPHYHMRPN